MEHEQDAERVPTARLRRLSSNALTADEVREIRALMMAAFGDGEEDRFEEADWEHALGGVHVVLDVAGRIVAHASVVERELHADGRPLQTGYVEAVATVPDLQGTGLGTTVMREIGAVIAAEYEIGALGTGIHHFYERLGWRTWHGPSFVRTPDGDRATPDDDGYHMVLETPRTPSLDRTGRLSCEWRSGDVW